MRIRDDRPGSVGMIALAAWLAACGGLALFSRGGVAMAIEVLLGSAPFIGVACMVLPWMYWRRHPEMPGLSNTVAALGLLLFILGVTAWYMTVGT